MPTVLECMRGCYAILDEDDEQYAEALVDPARGGARVLQLRIKPETPVSTMTLWRAAIMARRVTHKYGAGLIVNDRLDIAIAVDADGVHLGQTDLPAAAARRVADLAGSQLWIGVSTHSIEQVRLALACGADYLGFGPVFSTRTKRDSDPVQGVDALRAAVASAGAIPVVAIGGIDATNSQQVQRAGAAAACAIAAVRLSPDPAAAVRAIGAHWN